MNLIGGDIGCFVDSKGYLARFCSKCRWIKHGIRYAYQGCQNNTYREKHALEQKIARYGRRSYCGLLIRLMVQYVHLIPFLRVNSFASKERVMANRAFAQLCVFIASPQVPKLSPTAV